MPHSVTPAQKWNGHHFVEVRDLKDWQEELFAPNVVVTVRGQKASRPVPRTTAWAEGQFRKLQRHGRRIKGNAEVESLVQREGPGLLLMGNLRNPKYVRFVYGALTRLGATFARVGEKALSVAKKAHGAVGEITDGQQLLIAAIGLAFLHTSQRAHKLKYVDGYCIHMVEQVVTTVRLDKATLQLLDRVARSLHTDRSSLVRRAVHRGARAVLLDEAISKYVQGHLSAGAAKEWAGVSYAEFIDELRTRGLPYLTDEEGMRMELDELESQVKRRARGHH
jgi:predicted HTH domain antitoxin